MNFLGHDVKKKGALMQAYEFFAKPENGMIHIPEQYRDKITSDVKVIVLEEKRYQYHRKDANAIRKSDLLLPPTLDTSKWRFIRDEANER